MMKEIMKRIGLLVLSVFTVTLLTACLVIPGGENDGEPEGDGRVYASDVAVSLVVSDDGAASYIPSYYADFYKTLYEAGISVSRITDAKAVSGSEIAFGRTTRAASVYAYERIDAGYKSGNVTYAICYKGSTLAIAAAEYRYPSALGAEHPTFFISLTLPPATCSAVRAIPRAAV